MDIFRKGTPHFWANGNRPVVQDAKRRNLLAGAVTRAFIRVVVMRLANCARRAIWVWIGGWPGGRATGSGNAASTAATATEGETTAATRAGSTAKAGRAIGATAIGQAQAAHFSNHIWRVSFRAVMAETCAGVRVVWIWETNGIDLSLGSRIAAWSTGHRLPERYQGGCLGGIDGIGSALQLESADYQRFGQRERLGEIGSSRCPIGCRAVVAVAVTLAPQATRTMASTTITAARGVRTSLIS